MLNKLFFLSLICCVYGCFGKKSSIITGLEGKALPSFNLLLTDSITQFNTGNILTGQPIVLFLFSPNCPYCKAQTEDMVKNMKSLSNIRFFMISGFPLSQIEKYYSHYQLKKFPNIIVGQDYNDSVSKYFQAHAIPYMAIYNVDKQLKHVLIGNVGSKAIKDASID